MSVPPAAGSTAQSLLAVSPALLRRTMGAFATGVTVVSARDPTAGVHAMTANAFMSVSLRPPLVLVSLATTSAMHEVVTRAGHYAVSVLREDQEELARHFAGQRDCASIVRFSWWRDVPLLSDALAHLACRLCQAVPAGDHTLFLGSPLWLDRGVGAPLVVHNGTFGTVTSDRAQAWWWWS